MINAKKLKHGLKRFRIKLFSWEYWPIWLVYFPVSFYYIYLSIRARSFFFFSAANPSIETGGMFFESKWSIFKLIPKEFYPSTILVNSEDTIDEILNVLQSHQLNFPLIAKPDRGERGWCVKKLHTLEDLKIYRKDISISFLLQAYIDLPIELSIFYFRKPGNEKGAITSVTYKKLLTVTGDGYSTIRELTERDDRAFLQIKKIMMDPGIQSDHILQMNESKILVPYGNHVRGTTFIDNNHIIDERLVNTIDKISQSIQDFYYGRFDLRCANINDLKDGKNFSILELNGAGAEPAHIYDPSFSFFKAQQVLAQHYKMMFVAATENKKRGIGFMTFKSFLETKKRERQYKLQVETEI